MTFTSSRSRTLCEDTFVWGYQTSELAEHCTGTVQGPLQHSLRSFHCSAHHSFGSGWHHLHQSHIGALRGLRYWFSKSWTACFQAPCSFRQLRCSTCPYQMYPFQHYCQLSSGDGFRPSLQPCWSPLIHVFSLFFGGGHLQYPVPKWFLFLIKKVVFTACVVSFSVPLQKRVQTNTLVRYLCKITCHFLWIVLVGHRCPACAFSRVNLYAGWRD